MDLQAFKSFSQKLAADLTPAARSNLPKKDFAVSSKKSNTGEPAYPVEDKVHARVALGLAAMHHDKSDLAAVRAKIKAKFPDMLEKKSHLSPRVISAFAKEAADLLKQGALDLPKGLHAAMEEAGPAIGAVLGAGAAGAVGKSPLGGAALGYGAGSLPELLLGGKKKA